MPRDHAESLVETARAARIVAGMEAKAKSPPSFEDALTKLETIVEAMESGDVPLAALLAKFEEGHRPAKNLRGPPQRSRAQDRAAQEGEGRLPYPRSVTRRARRVNPIYLNTEFTE